MTKGSRDAKPDGPLKAERRAKPMTKPKRRGAAASTSDDEKPRRPGKRGGQSFSFTLSNDILRAETGAVVSFLINRTASKSVAVNVAVTNQLVHDGRWPPMDVTKVMSAIPYRYEDKTMRNFLDGVKTTLAAALPPFVFSWNGAFVTRALGLTVAELMGAIELATE